MKGGISARSHPAIWYCCGLPPTRSRRVVAMTLPVRPLLPLAAWLLFALLAGGAREADKEIVIYSSNDATLNELVFATFAKETGIAVQPVEAGTGVLVKRLGAEKERPQGDVIWGMSRSILQSNTAYFAPYHSKNVDAIPAEYRDPDDLWIGNNLHLLVVLQNTKLVPEAQAPRRQ